MLITEERSSAGAVVGQLGSSNALGIVEGLGTEGLLKMSYVSGLEKVAVGDRVWTTGQDGIYPPGLSVGEVVEFTAGSASAHHSIKIKPTASLSAAEEVAVLQYQPPARAPLDQALPNIVKGRK
ncbi:MAG: rod shape-determining protein MreC [Pyrinomonadaceae bacterium]